jgi:hypothetical protein
VVGLARVTRQYVIKTFRDLRRAEEQRGGAGLNAFVRLWHPDRLVNEPLYVRTTAELVIKRVTKPTKLSKQLIARTRLLDKPSRKGSAILDQRKPKRLAPQNQPRAIARNAIPRTILHLSSVANAGLLCLQSAFDVEGIGQRRSSSVVIAATECRARRSTVF